MMTRNVAARIVKLEARRYRPDEILLIWRRPDADVTDAIKGADFAPGDRVICVEWFGEGPLPAPKWYRERLTRALDAPEEEYLYKSLERVIDGERDGTPRDPGFAKRPAISEQRMKELTDNELLHMIFGVAT